MHGNSDNNNDEIPISEDRPIPVDRQHNHSRPSRGGKPQRPYNDLRQLLNEKRQNHSESKFNGPPPEPRYSFLSDPLRDNEHDSSNNQNETLEHVGSGRFPPQYNSVTYENKNRNSGRGRPNTDTHRGHNNYRRNHYGRPPGDFRKDEWRDERSKIDQERINRQRSEDGGWKREWDAGKEEVWKDLPGGQNKPKHSPQHRSVYYPRANQSNKKPDQSQNFEKPSSYRIGESQNFEKPSNYRSGESQNFEKPSNYRSGENTENKKYDKNYDNREQGSPSYPRPRKYNQEPGNQNHRPPQRNNYNKGPKNYQKKKNSKPDPVNITVQYTVETGERKCTVENITPKKNVKAAKKINEKQTMADEVIVDNIEENWDEEDTVATEQEELVKDDTAHCDKDTDTNNENINVENEPKTENVEGEINLENVNNEENCNEEEENINSNCDEQTNDDNITIEKKSEPEIVREEIKSENCDEEQKNSVEESTITEESTKKE